MFLLFVSSGAMFCPFLSPVTFPRVFEFLLKWPLSLLYIFSLHYFASVSPVGFCIHFSQCNISSIMKVQLITSIIKGTENARY